MQYRIFILLILLTACRKDQPTPDLGKDYFPIDSARYTIWDVDSIVHIENDLGGGTDSFNYQIKEIQTGLFTDNEGRPSMRIERYFRLNKDSIWQLSRVSYATVTDYRAERIEENIRSIALIFPPVTGNKWDGNALNTFEQWDYVYDAVDQSETINGLTFDSVLTVKQRDDANLVLVQQASEKYARGVGLVQKDSIWSEPLSGAGLEYYMLISEYGKE